MSSPAHSSSPRVTQVWERALRAAVALFTDDARLRVAHAVWKWLSSADETTDLYYLAYALETARAMEVAISPSVLEYVEAIQEVPRDLPHLVSLIRCRRSLALPPNPPAIQEAISAWTARLESLADLPDQRAYVRFLLRVAHELLAPDSATIHGLGPANSNNRPSATPTVAAQLVCKVIAGEPAPSELAWLRRCHAPTGGWHASPDSPQPDLVSTASALVALQMAAAPHVATEADFEFLEAHATSDGGYGRTPDAESSDVESIWLVFVSAGCMLPPRRRRRKTSPWKRTWLL